MRLVTHFLLQVYTLNSMYFGMSDLEYHFTAAFTVAVDQARKGHQKLPGMLRSSLLQLVYLHVLYVCFNTICDHIVCVFQYNM